MLRFLWLHEKLMAGMSNTSAKRDLYLANTNSIMPDCFRRNKNKAASFSPVTLETEPTTASHTQGQALEQVTMSCILHELQSHPKHETETIQEYEKISFYFCAYMCICRSWYVLHSSRSLQKPGGNRFSELAVKEWRNFRSTFKLLWYSPTKMWKG